MLFLQFVQYSSSFVGTSKNEIPGAALELCQLKIKQFSAEILKFSTKHEDNHFTLKYYMVSRTFLFIFHAGSRRLGSNNFRDSSYRENTAGSARISRLSFRFLWLWSKLQNGVFLRKYLKWNLNVQNWSKALCLCVSALTKRLVAQSIAYDLRKRQSKHAFVKENENNICKRNLNL